MTPVAKITGAKAEQYTVLLTGEGQLHARVDCNRGGAAEKISARFRPAPLHRDFMLPILVDS
jgi:hypothetical protein